MASTIPAAFASTYSATKAGLNALARALRAEARGEGLGLDVLSVTPGYVRAGNSPVWVGGGSSSGGGASGGGASDGLAEPDDVARAALLLLPTAPAHSPVLSPLLGDALIQAVTALLPEGMLARMVYGRHAGQREKALGREGE